MEASRRTLHQRISDRIKITDRLLERERAMWPFVMLEVIATMPLKAPLVLGDEPVSIVLLEEGDIALRARLQSLRDDPARTIVLVLREVGADTAPQASWEIYVGPANAAAPCAAETALVGVFSLYEPDPAADYVFPVDGAIGAGDFRSLKATFVPVSGVTVAGRPAPVSVRARVTIGEIGLGVDEAGPDGEP